MKTFARSVIDFAARRIRLFLNWRKKYGGKEDFPSWLNEALNRFFSNIVGTIDISRDNYTLLNTLQDIMIAIVAIMHWPAVLINH